MSRDLILFALSLMIWGVGEGVFFYFQPLYLQQLGASPVVIGAILGAAGVVMTITHIPAGYLADRIGRRPLIWTSWITGMIAAWMMALAYTLPVFVAALLVYSSTTFVMAPMLSYVTAARGRLSVGRAITLISASYNAGAILGPWLGGLAGDRFGLRSIYAISALFFTMSVLIILFIRPQPLDHRATEHHKPHLNIDRRYIAYLLVVFLAMFSTYLPQPLSSNFLQNERGLSVGEIGRLGSFASIGVVVLNLTLGSINPRLGFLFAQASVVVFALALWQGQAFPWYALGYFLMGGYRVARALAAAQTRALVQKGNMGLAYGITETIGASAIILAPPLAGYLYEIKPTLIYNLGVILILVSILVSTRLHLTPDESSV